ncbi:anti-sigma factor domain-containing protein [Paenibacillus sp. N1-5-1-14]|uniref:anti-sigma factor domain-containing protein n=1 Tax=Paenibacillus radicibacter TaxID=2972488 RepID=UPI002158F56E|nr:anti-sigma factor domain-containing protein [Paenibacillus radicibacter]MCR8645599.1 anti-sigma factor domain-containing protein [Paenibacillus radicibacter]
MQGVVFKITEDKIVVLCDDGKFRNLPHSPEMPVLGQKITVPEIPIVQEKKKTGWKLQVSKRCIAVASFLLLIGIAWILNVSLRPAPTVAMVAIDINPSIELFIDDKGKVNKTSFVNEDSKTLLQEKDLLGKEFYEAVGIIIHAAKKQGYIDLETDKKYVLMSVVDTGKAAFQVDASKVTPDQDDVQLELYYADQQKQEKAKEAGLTLNKYIVYEQAKQMGIEIELEELRTHSVVASLNHAGVDPQRFFKKEATPVKDDKVKETKREESKKQEDNKGEKKPAQTSKPASSNQTKSHENNGKREKEKPEPNKSSKDRYGDDDRRGEKDNDKVNKDKHRDRDDDDDRDDGKGRDIDKDKDKYKDKDKDKNRDRDRDNHRESDKHKDKNDKDRDDD